MFVKEEINGKKTLVKKLLADEKLDGIYLKRSANFAWITAGGHNLIGLATEIGVIGLLITANKDYVVCNNIEAPRMEKEELLCEQGYEIQSFTWIEDKEAQIVFSLAGKAVGSDCGLPGSTDITGKMNPLRYALTPWEVDRYKDLGRMAAATMEEVAETIRPGDTEGAVVGRMLERLWARGADSVLPYCAADERITVYRHPITKNNPIKKRAMLCCNTRKGGLITSMTRFIHFGKVPSEMQKLYEDNIYIDHCFMTATIPGRPACEAFRAGLDAYVEKGYPEEHKLHHQGGAIGYMVRDYRTTLNTKDIIRENQAFAWNPSITSVKSEDTMLTTSAGPVILTEPVLFPSKVFEKNGYKFRRAMMLEL